MFAVTSVHGSNWYSIWGQLQKLWEEFPAECRICSWCHATPVWGCYMKFVPSQLSFSLKKLFKHLLKCGCTFLSRETSYHFKTCYFSTKPRVLWGTGGVVAQGAPIQLRQSFLCTWGSMCSTIKDIEGQGGKQKTCLIGREQEKGGKRRKLGRMRTGDNTASPFTGRCTTLANAKVFSFRKGVSTASAASRDMLPAHKPTVTSSQTWTTSR